MWENNVKIKFFITLEINQSLVTIQGAFMQKKLHSHLDILINIKLYVLIGSIIWHINYILINMCECLFCFCFVFYKK